MTRFLHKHITFGLITTVLLLIAVGVVSVHSARNLVHYAQLHSEHERLRLELETLLSSVKDVETARRGYVLSDNESYLEPYYEALPVIQDSLASISEMLAQDPERLQQFQAVSRLVEERIAVVRSSIELMRQIHANSPELEALSEQGKEKMDQLRLQVGEMIRHQTLLLNEDRDKALSISRTTTVVIVTGAIFSVAQLLIVLVILDRQIRRRVAIEKELEKANHDLRGSLHSVQTRTQQIRQLADLTDMLQVCTSTAEALEVLPQRMPGLFNESSGCFCITNPSRNLVEVVARWGDTEGHAQVFEPDTCWGIRRGKTHVVEPGNGQITCGHLAAALPNRYACTPMVAQGEGVGVMFLQSDDPEVFSSENLPLINHCAEQVAMALTNLRLRDKLQNQAVRDGLSGLYNRRYLLETLEREVQRALREEKAISILMIDIDHFKQFNDQFGHAAGDTIIRELGKLLQRFVRGSDIACRYGGEEFTLILPDASKEIGILRAEQLLDTVSKLRVTHEKTDLGPITLSIGVCAYSQDSHSVDDLLKAADSALYEAKKRGRNCVVAAVSSPSGDGKAKVEIAREGALD